jgi:hypothetical protein
MEKAERFRPGFGKKHREEADVAYAAAKRAGNSERDRLPEPAPVATEPADGGGA